MKSQELTKLNLPDTPGVYLFLKKAPSKGILYVGKATSLKDRVKSYFAGDLVAARGEHIVQMVAEADTVEYRPTDSVLEALMLEAELIRHLKPPYNTLGKDDKSFNHVIITKEPFPRVLLVRGHDLEEFAARWAAAESGEAVTLKTRPLAGGTILLSFPKRAGLKSASSRLLAIYGPFPHAGQLREAMRIVRKVFPFRDKCTPCAHIEVKLQCGLKLDFNVTGCRPCFNAQIGACPGVCSGAMTQKEYAHTIRHLKLFFEGKKSQLMKEIERDMKASAKAQEFERAAELRGRIFALNHIQDVALIKENPSVGREKPYRIEAYDIAHMAGEHTVGVMVLVEDGVAQKSDYRKFKIQHKGINDIAGLREVLTRRLKHEEWQLPDLVAVDGSTTQKRAAEEALREHFGNQSNLLIPVVGVVKNARHMPERLIGPTRIIARHERSILLANSEAHRFAITYHRSKRKIPH
jgi:excinuclease ABC subunit C